MHHPSRPPRHHADRARRVGVAALCAAALVTAGCAHSAHTSSNNGLIHVNGDTSASSGIRGVRLSRPVTLTAASAAAVFRSTAGHDTTLAALGQGRLMLLYFGYTHCPDVCPTTMADIAVALRQVPAQISGHTQVVFVTSDPARDTTAVLSAWLAHFDTGLPTPFVGLTATTKQIDTVANSVGVPISAPVRQPDGSISVQHGAQTLAFTARTASVAWLAGTSTGDYAHDITQLAMNPATQ